MEKPIYLDNHATTQTDPRVLDAMLPFFCRQYGNAGSTSHAFGWAVQAAVDQARQSIGQQIGAQAREIIFTSGATESNNLAIRGVCERTRRRGNHAISVATEHRAVLDPLARLEKHGFEVTLLPVRPHGHEDAGTIDVEQLAAAIRDDTVLVSVMAANNEIGVLQPMEEIGRCCRQRGVVFHTDATQAVGKIPVDVERWQVDLMSFSGHKIYGPKGIGALFVRRRTPRVRLESQIDGGRQEYGFRSGTANVPGIVGLAKALELCRDEGLDESSRLAHLRDHLYDGLRQRIAGISLNGPTLQLTHLRLPGNLNCCFGDVDGEALMMNMRDLAVSSGSACSSADPTPSHVLQALGLNTDQTRASLRFGLGRFNTLEQVEFAIQSVVAATHHLRQLHGSDQA